MDSTNTTGVETGAVSDGPSLPNETSTFGNDPKHGTAARDVETEAPGSKRKRAPLAEAEAGNFHDILEKKLAEIDKATKERRESKRQFRADMADAIGDIRIGQEAAANKHGQTEIEIETERLEQSVTSTEAEITALKTRLEQLEKQMGWVLEYLERFA